MNYTLSMAADQGIRIAADGVAEVSMTDARAHLTELIRGVRYGKGVAAFTERGQRSAYVVTPDAFQQARSDRRLVRAFELAGQEKTETADEFLAAVNRKLIDLVEEDTAAGEYSIRKGVD